MKVPKRWRDLLMCLPLFNPFALSEGCWFDPEVAERYVDFFPECLTHVEGALAKQPFVLEEWQRSTVANLFGWMRIDEKGRVVRRFRTLFYYVPRKNGKTPFVAGLCLAVMTQDGEVGADMYGFGSTTEQATLLYKHATGMVNNEPLLAERLEIYKGVGQRAIHYPEFQASYKVLSGEAKGKHGHNPHFAAIDELHEQPNRELVDTIETSFASLNRKQPLLAFLTTADHDREESICNEKLEVARRVRDNPGDRAQPGYDPTFLPVIYEADREKDDWKDPRVWARVNPNLDVSVSREYLEDACRKAVEDPALENTFKRLHLNMRTEQATRWMPMDVWDKCGGAVIEDDLLGRICYGGLDLSSVGDTTSFTLIFPPTDDDPLWRILPRIWVPRETARRDELKKSIPYSIWAEQGLIRISDGERIEYAEIQAQIESDATDFGLQLIGADKWNLEYLRQVLDPEGSTIIEFGQGFRSFSPPMKDLLIMARAGEIAHGGHAVMRWQMGNVAAVTDDAANIKPSKKKSASKIDCPVSTIMALGVARAGETEEPSVYETRGILTL